VGDVVRVAEGPFRGYTGTVVRDLGRLRLIVTVSMLRQSVAVEFDREKLGLASARHASTVRRAVA
jgi:transcription antitermination factor NusG